MNEKIKIAVCDDNLQDIQLLEQCLEKYKKNNGVEFDVITFTSGYELLKYEERIELLFLDIELNAYGDDTDEKKLDGIDIMNKLLSDDNIWKIVFVSSHTEKVFDSFGLKTLGFVEKPVSEEKVNKWLDILFEEYSENAILTFKSSVGEIYIRQQEIVYIKAEKNNSIIKTTKSEYCVLYNLAHIIEMLNAKYFVRIHKSYVVNLNYVNNINTICAVKDAELPVGRKYALQSKQVYKEYIKYKIQKRMA